jgi:hypothetical protein
MFFKKGLRDSSLIQKLIMKTSGCQSRCFPSPTGMPWPRRRPSTQESRRRSRVTQISLAHREAMTRRESWIVLSMQLNELIVIRSTGPGLVNLKASWIAFAFSTPRESTRPESMTDSKVWPMRFSRRPSQSIKRRSPRIPRVTSRDPQGGQLYFWWPRLV